jgi:hypothetical protein
VLSFWAFLKIFVIVIYAVTASVVWGSEFLATDSEARVRFPALPDFLRGCGSGTGEYN